MKRRQLFLVLGLAAAMAAPVQAQQFFRIGTGGTAGTYYPVGGMIANAVSQPGKIVATAQATNGSVANVNGVAGGAMESGFSQSDVATWAYTGTGVYEGKPKVADLRMIANLYPESIHLVVKKGSGIKSVADLKGKRVALDEPGSGTLVNARTVLAAYGVKESDIKPEYIKPNQAGDKLKDGALDAFFFVGGAPAGRALWPRLALHSSRRNCRRQRGRTQAAAHRLCGPPLPAPPARVAAVPLRRAGHRRRSAAVAARGLRRRLNTWEPMRRIAVI